MSEKTKKLIAELNAAMKEEKSALLIALDGSGVAYIAADDQEETRGNFSESYHYIGTISDIVAVDVTTLTESNQ